METFKEIPTFSRYEISELGTIREKETGEIIKPFFSSRRIPIVSLKKDNWKWVTGTVAKLVLMAYKPIPEEKIPYGSAFHKDGSRLNYRLSNLKWLFGTYKPPLVPGKNVPIDTKVPVLGYPRYKIDGYGNVYLDDNETPIHVSMTKGRKFVAIGKGNSDGPGGTYVHRLLALTFLEHPIDASQLVVNHKDGNPSNNDLSNLEWVTYSRNIEHAYQTGLRTENDQIIVMNVKTRKVRVFYSLGECARFFGDNTGALHWQLNDKKELRPYKGYFVQYKDRMVPWPKKDAVFKKCACEGTDIVAKNTATGEVAYYTSAIKLGKALGMNPSSARYQLKKKTPTPYRGYLLRFGKDSSAFD